MINLYKLILREMKIHMSSLTNLWSFISLFFLGILIFVFAVGSESNNLSQLYLPIVWVIFLFSLILGAETFLLEDHNDGSLKELQFLGYSKEIIILAKSISMWIIYIIPSIFIIPLFSIMFSISFNYLIFIIINILLASPSLILIAIISGLFALQLKKNRILQFVIIIPFYIPPLIFGTMHTYNESSNILENHNFFILIAIFFITLPLTLFIGKLLLKEIYS